MLVAAGLIPVLAACDYIPSSHPFPEPPAATSTPPAAAPAAAPELRPAVEAVALDRLAEILAAPARPTPRAGARPGGSPEPTAGPAHLPPWEEHDQSRYYRSGFACTGSMRPAIDCGDEGVFLKPPFQEPLAVGEVISFYVGNGCNHYQDHRISKAHRIVSVREEEDGAYFYTTKGDSALSPDSCEVAIEHIDGKLVNLEKGARPQDVRDVSRYDYARERVRHLQAWYETMRNSFDQRHEAYLARGEEYRRLAADYRNGGPVGYEQVMAVHQELEEERLALSRLMEELNSLGEEINAAIAELDGVYRELFIR
jgi:hypothetical protein